MTVLGIIILVLAVGLLIAGFKRVYRYDSKALYAALACFVGSFGLALLFDGIAVWLFWTGVIALVALILSRGLARFVVVVGVILTLIVGWPFGIHWNKQDSKTTTSSGASPSPTVSPAATGLSEKDAHAIGTQLNKIYPDFKPGEIAVGGSSAIPKSKEERGAYAFTKKTIRTREDLVKFLGSTNSLAVETRKRVEQSLRKAGYGDAEVHEALTSGERWIWVAPKVESQILGTTYSVKGSVLQSNKWRQVAPNDAIWFYITSDLKIVKGASVRADCGNSHVDKVRPVRPNTPKVPPIENPCDIGTPTTVIYNGKPVVVCPKDPTKDVNVDPSVPPGVRGPGTTPVGTDPGPATQTYDTPTGCNGPCPRPSGDPKPSPSPTDRPQGDPNGGSGNGGATPGPGPTDDSDAGQTTSPAPSASSGPICGTGNPDDC